MVAAGGRHGQDQEDELGGFDDGPEGSEEDDDDEDEDDGFKGACLGEQRGPASQAMC